MSLRELSAFLARYWACASVPLGRAARVLLPWRELARWRAVERMMRRAQEEL